ncbi:MAG TPA: ferritin-like domain-containing protein [Nocardioidaceae bacterium]|nr:ferritin-like domain-containing protein [Nocardioidaceae bacterium]
MTETYDDVGAQQACLAAEHAAVYVYGVIGGRIAGLRAPADVVERVDESYEFHRGRRDFLDQAIRDLGADPVAAEPAYALPVTPASLRQCQRLARYVENRCTQTYAYAVSLASPQTRGRLALDLAATAVRAAAWGARLDAFPGRPDL